MGNHDAPAHHQPHREQLLELLVGHALFGAAKDVVGDAVVAAEHERGDQAEHLLDLGAEHAGLVGPVVQREEAVDREVAGAQDRVVHPGAERLEVGEGIGHGLKSKHGLVFTQSSDRGSAFMPRCSRALLAVVVALAAACQPAPSFVPGTVTVMAGDTLRLTLLNPEDDAHTFVLPGLTLALPGQSRTDTTYVAGPPADPLTATAPRSPCSSPASTSAAPPRSRRPRPDRRSAG